MIKIKRKNLMIFFIMMYILLQCTIIFTSSRITNILKILSIIGMLLVSSRISIGKRDSKIIFIYISLLFSTIIGMAMEGSLTGYIQFLKIGLWISVFIWILCTSKEEGFIDSFMNVYSTVAFIISIQCLILFFVVMFDIMPGNAVYKEARGGELSYGILGYGNATNYFGSFKILRTMSFFREPSNLASFLIPSLFWCGAKYKIDKSKKWIIFIGIIGLNFLATFSRAGFVAFAIGMLGMLFLRPVKNSIGLVSREKKTSGMILIVAGVVAVIILGNFLYRFVLTEDEFYAGISSVSSGFEGMLNRTMTLKSSYNNIFIRDDSNFPLIFSFILKNPFGYGLGWTGRQPLFNNPTGLGFWLYSGGFLAAVVIIILYFYLVREYYLECTFSTDYCMRALGASFVGITMQNMSYGTWVGIDYLLIIAFMVSLVEQRKERLKTRNSYSCQLNLYQGQITAGASNYE